MAESGSTLDFQLPDEILSVIPADPYEQLNLARKITSLAIASRVSKLESESGLMRQKITDKDRVISELQSRISDLESRFRETDARLSAAIEENIKLLKERDSLLLDSRKMSRDLAKMETFKRHLMESLNDDNKSTETVDIGTCNQSVAKTTTQKVNVPTGLNTPISASESTEMGNAFQDGTSDTRNKALAEGFYHTSTLPWRQSSKQSSEANSPLRSRPLPDGTNDMTSKALDEGYNYPSMSPWCPSSKQSSATNSPPRGRPLQGRNRVDGKEFFRQAKNRLTYEQFAAFLANVKELNAQRQSREETLKKAEEIFGNDNKDLYLFFKGLLGRNMPS